MSIRQHLQRAVIVIALGAAMFGCAGHLSAGPFERAVPKDCVLFAKLEDVSSLAARLEQIRLVKLVKDPVMRPFVDGLLAEFKKVAGGLEQRNSINPLDIIALMNGQAAIAARLDPQAPSEPPFVYFLLDVGENQAGAQAFLTQVGTAIEEQGFTKQTDAGVTVFSKPNQGPRERVCYVLKESTIVFANDVTAVRQTAGAVAAGMADSLAENPRFQAMQAQLGEGRDLRVFLDVGKLIETAGKLSPQADLGIKVLQLDALQSLGASVGVNQGDFEWHSKVVLLSNKQSHVQKLFSMPPKPLQPESWVPNDVVSYSSFAWDIDQFYNSLSIIVNGLGGGAMSRLEATLAESPESPISSIKRDVVGPLGNRISFVTDLHTSQGVPASRVLLAWQLDDSKSFSGLVDRLTGLTRDVFPFDRKTVKGNTVYMLPVGDILRAQGLEEKSPTPVEVLALTVTKTHFFLATHVELLDKVLNFEGAQGLASSADYRKIATKFAPATSWITYVRSDENARVNWELVRSGKLAKAIEERVAAQPNSGDRFSGVIEALRGSNLPQFDAVKQYFIATGTYAEMTDEKASIVSFSLKN